MPRSFRLGVRLALGSYMRLAMSCMRASRQHRPTTGSSARPGPPAHTPFRWSAHRDSAGG